MTKNFSLQSNQRKVPKEELGMRKIKRLKYLQRDQNNLRPGTYLKKIFREKLIKRIKKDTNKKPTIIQ